MYNTIVKNPIHLIHVENGIIHTFKDFDEVVSCWPWIRNLPGNIGEQFKVRIFKGKWDWFRYSNGEPVYRHYTYILKDSFGDVLDPDIIADSYRKLHPYRSWWYPNHRSTGRHFRRRCFRQPRTTHERRWANAWDNEEFPPKVRARRNYHNLPNAWDDIQYSDWDNRNWKKFRKHQWKGK